jgi:hypothetical protein
MVRNLFTAWVKIDDTLPWIELKGEYQTRMSAHKAANQILKDAEIKIIRIERTKHPLKVLATAKARR